MSHGFASAKEYQEPQSGGRSRVVRDKKKGDQPLEFNEWSLLNTDRGALAFCELSQALSLARVRNPSMAPGLGKCLNKRLVLDQPSFISAPSISPQRRIVLDSFIIIQLRLSPPQAAHP